MRNEPMNPTELSSAGTARRTAMKSELQARMGRIHRSRRRRRTVAATGFAIALTVSLGVAGWRAMLDDAGHGDPEARLAGGAASEPTGSVGANSGAFIVSRAGSPSAGIIRRVETDPSAAERWRAVSSDAPAVVVEWIRDDAELLDALAAADHPTGFIRMNGEIRFTNPKLR